MMYINRQTNGLNLQHNITFIITINHAYIEILNKVKFVHNTIHVISYNLFVFLN